MMDKFDMKPLLIYEDKLIINKKLEQFREDTIFLESIRPELLCQYPDCWIAIYQKEVVGIASKMYFFQPP